MLGDLTTALALFMFTTMGHRLSL
eukprot:COSAG02_NODE_2325_length_9132_cov_16.589752_1_plen_23_part_10